MSYKATPEQWQTIEGFANQDLTVYSCLLELRDRISALETQREAEKACIQEIYDSLDWLKVRHESNWSRIVKLEEAHQQPEPIDEEENERRFRACLAAIDNTTPEQVKAAVAKASAKLDPQAPAPAGGLVERVAFAIGSAEWESDETPQWTEEANAAILAVAEWMDGKQDGQSQAARWLREEVERG
jgi:hypothetical protein